MFGSVVGSFRSHFVVAGLVVDSVAPAGFDSGSVVGSFQILVDSFRSLGSFRIPENTFRIQTAFQIRILAEAWHIPFQILVAFRMDSSAASSSGSGSAAFQTLVVHMDSA